MALEKCHLSSSHVPASKPIISFHHPSTSDSTTADGTHYSSAWKYEHEMSELGRRRRTKKSSSAGRTRDLLGEIRRNKEESEKRVESYRRNAESLADEIDYVVRQTGVKKVKRYI